MTINQTAKAVGLPSSCLRKMLENNSLPGFYNGTRYYVNVEMLEDKLKNDCRSAMCDYVEDF